MILDAELCSSIQQYQQNVHLYFLLPFGIQRGMIKDRFLLAATRCAGERQYT